MISAKTLLITAVGTGCLVTSGVGGYLAVKSNVSTPTDTPVAAAEALPAGATAVTSLEPPSGDLTAPSPVTESKTGVPAGRAAERPARDVAPRTEARRTQSPAPVRETAAAPFPAPAPIVENVPTPVETVAVAPDPAPVVAPAPTTRELTIPRSSVIGIQLERGVSSETARLEDRVVARVTRDVRVDDVVVIPAGARLEGNVTLVERGGRFKERARIGVQFTTLVVDDARMKIQTEAILREGEGPAKDATTKIGASAVIGSILGAVIGGGKGAAIGGAAGAAGGGAVVAAGGRSEVTIPEGASLTVRLTEPVSLTVSRE